MVDIRQWIKKYFNEDWMESLLENCIPVGLEAWIDDANEGHLSAGLKKKELEKLYKELQENGS